MGLSLKTGTEPFRSGAQVLWATVLDYWRWSGSDLMNNRERSILGEFLVAMALGLEKEPRLEWNAYDLKTSSGLKIEIKTSSAKQSWSQSKPSSIRFDIAPKKYAWDAKTDTTDYELKRHADVYVFCELHGDDPLDTAGWRFYVLSTEVLNQRVPNQKSIGLQPLRNLDPTISTYADLKQNIESVNVPHQES
jgi:hypothetical protein